MSFKAEDKPKKHISELTKELKPFWETLFDAYEIGKPTFGAKLGYMGKEFGEPRVACVRFFPNELSSGNDYYLELFDWDQNPFHEGQRVLYKHKFDPEWEKKIGSKYITVEVASLSTPTYAIKVSDLELVNETDIKAAYPELNTRDSSKEDEVPWYEDEEKQTEMFIEQDDDHYTKMTIRDLYCMMNEVPMSNKKWLNKLIKNGSEWKRKTMI
jgi:hypothetical protein